MRLTCYRYYAGFLEGLTLLPDQTHYEHWLSRIDGAASTDALSTLMQKLAESHGFGAFVFADAVTASFEEAVVAFTWRPEWQQVYEQENFIDADPVVAFARRTNAPFFWHEAPVPERIGRRLPRATRVMRAASDHGYHDGFAIPYHYVDRHGRAFSTIVSFFGESRELDFARSPIVVRRHLHLLAMAWAQRFIELTNRAEGRPARFLTREGEPLGTVRLTDRERDALSWAARGKTSAETALILGISHETVTKHLHLAMKKLGATNRTAAVALAIHTGLISL